MITQTGGTNHDTGSSTSAATESVTSSQINNAFMVIGSVNFTAATSVQVNFPVMFTTASSYTCTVTDASAVGRTFFVTNTSNQTMTITASASNSDSVNFNCVGYLTGNHLHRRRAFGLAALNFRAVKILVGRQQKRTHGECR